MDNKISIADMFLISTCVILLTIVAYAYGRSSIRRDEIAALRDAFRRKD